MDTNQELIAFADQQRETLEGVGLSDALVQIFNQTLERKDRQMGYFKKQEMEKMENERLQERDQDQEPTMSDEQMRLVAQKFLVAICASRLEYRNFKIMDDSFGKFSDQDWETFKRFVQFAL